MALPSELSRIRARIRSKAAPTIAERNLLAELDGLDNVLRSVEVANLEVRVTKTTGGGESCPCCGRG